MIPLSILFLKNQARDRPLLFGTRALAGAAFGIGAVALAGWFGSRLRSGAAGLEAAAPVLFERGFTHLLHALLSALLPLMVISQAVTALACLFKNADARFLLALPWSPTSLFFSRGLRIYGAATGFVHLLVVPFLWGFGGGPYAVRAMVPLTLFLLVTFGAGMLFIFALASVFRVATLHRAFSFFFALFAVLFIVAFRGLRPEALAASPAAFLLALDRPPAGTWMPSWPAARALAGLRSGGPLAPAGLLWPALGLCAGAYLAFRLGYFRLYSRAQSQGMKVRMALRSRIRARSFAVNAILKEWLSLLRHPTRLAQGMLMASLILLYLANFAVLPLRSDPLFGAVYRGLHVFLSGFILAALGLRFAFPAPSLEGPAVRFLQGLPVGARTLFAARTIAYALPLSAVALVLTGSVWWGLGLSAGEAWTFAFIGTGMAVAFSAAGVAAGSLHPRYRNPDPLQVGFSPEGLGYFFVCLAVTAAVTWAYLKDTVRMILD